MSVAVVRRNLVFNASTASCGIGAGLAIRAVTSEIYHNTLDNLRPLATTGCGNPWSMSEKHAVWVIPDSGIGARTVVWKHRLDATHPYTQSGTFTRNATRNLFQQGFSGMPPGSIIGDPRYVTDQQTTTTLPAKALPPETPPHSCPAAWPIREPTATIRARTRPTNSPNPTSGSWRAAPRGRAPRRGRAARRVVSRNARRWPFLIMTRRYWLAPAAST